MSCCKSEDKNQHVAPLAFTNDGARLTQQDALGDADQRALC